MELKTKFEEAVVNSKNLAQKPGNDTLLQLYGLYKQSTEGDLNIVPPANPFDFVAKAKFEAWEQLIGMPKDAAMEQYIALVKSLQQGA